MKDPFHGIKAFGNNELEKPIEEERKKRAGNRRVREDQESYQGEECKERSGEKRALENRGDDKREERKKRASARRAH